MSKHLRPGMIPFWMLNDASIVQEKIEYMRSCHAGGIEALAMHCRSGNLVPYASTEWFEMIRALVEEGKRLGMDMWLYDEDPYPSGAAGGIVMAERPDLRAEYLACHEAPATLKPGQLWFIGKSRVTWAGLVPDCEPRSGRPVFEPLPPRDLTDTVGIIRADWFMTKWDSRHYYPDTPVFQCPRGDTVHPQFTMRVPLIPHGYRLIALTAEPAGIEGVWGTLPDLLNHETFNLFKELTLDMYERYVGSHYGKTIPGIFTDEAKPHGGMPITNDMFESFSAGYGYDLRSRLYQLFGNPLSEEYEKTRIDYRQWVFNRFLNAFVRPYREYCDAHNLYLVGHFSPEDDPIQEASCLGSVMPVMKLMSCAGTDIIVPYTGNSKAPALNLGSLRAASVRSQNRQPCATSESLGLSGWQVTSQQCRQIFAWQKVLGIDRFFTHGFFNSNEGVGNYEAPPDFGPYSSIFKGICAVNEWLKEIESVMDGAKDRVDTAVVNSAISFWNWAPGADISHLKGLRKSLWLTILSCLRAHVGVHLVDENDLASVEIQSGMPRKASPRGVLVVGEQAYATVIVPSIDFMSEEAFLALQSAVEAGVSVFWFGKGPKRLINKKHEFVACPFIGGTVLNKSNPDDTWCRKHLAQVTGIKGKESGECYVKSFTARDGVQYLLAVNVSGKRLGIELCKEKESGLYWMPQRIDGDALIVKDGIRWTVPPCGAGLFMHGQAQALDTPVPLKKRRINLRTLTFKRLSPNILRLNQVKVRCKDKPVFGIDYPRPYWQLFSDFSAKESVSTFAGELPVESKVKRCDLEYSFALILHGKIKTPRLILDPRCARGRFRIFLNGRPLGPVRVFPLERTTQLRVPLRELKQGTNMVELRFHIKSAMEGLLSQLYIEGDFDVDLKKKPVISPPQRRISENGQPSHSVSGWQVAGMPHYMGEGLYRWHESFSAEDLEAKWTLELEKIVDSAELFVNGEGRGVQAWAPWRWKLLNLKLGKNIFELRVSGTAGNKHELDWPNQPQGWIGAGAGSNLQITDNGTSAMLGMLGQASNLLIMSLHEF